VVKTKKQADSPRLACPADHRETPKARPRAPEERRIGPRCGSRTEPQFETDYMPLAGGGIRRLGIWSGIPRRFENECLDSDTGRRISNHTGQAQVHRFICHSRSHTSLALFNRRTASVANLRTRDSQFRGFAPPVDRL
jgi:hypothetical protein